MLSAAQRRFALALLLVLVLCAPGLAAAGPRAQARPVAAPASLLETVFGRLRDLVHQLWEGRGGAGDTGDVRATTGTGLQNVHANAGCGIDPNGDGCPHW